MRKCPNCQKDWPYYPKVCPYCGTTPEPSDMPTGGKYWVQVILGVLSALISPFLAGIGLIVAIILHFALKSSAPAFARGLGVGLILVGILLLGAFVVCLLSFGGIH